MSARFEAKGLQNEQKEEVESHQLHYLRKLSNQREFPHDLTKPDAQEGLNRGLNFRTRVGREFQVSNLPAIRPFPHHGEKPMKAPAEPMERYEKYQIEGYDDTHIVEVKAEEGPKPIKVSVEYVPLQTAEDAAREEDVKRRKRRKGTEMINKSS
ncbi:hypothetical protein PCE1_004667 [Barthelona sp. PCE]